MVFFVCEGCNETLKKNQVDKHASQCRRCEAVTCVDCQVTFYGNDYAAHTSCISEAEKYEKSLYKAKPGADKPKPQDIWIALIENIESYSDKAPVHIRPFLGRLAALSNVPRNKKKFQNFAKNSLNIRSDGILEEIWTFVDSLRQQNEASSPPATTTAASSSSSRPQSQNQSSLPPIAVAVVETTEDDEKETPCKRDKKDKKDKKKKRKQEDAEISEAAEPAVREESSSKKQKVEVVEVEEVYQSLKHKKDKKEKKHKKDKKHKKESAEREII